MSRVHPRKLIVEGQRVKIAGSSDNAVGIMLGVVTECYLVNEGKGGSTLSPYPVHKISIVPFAQEMRRETSLWGQLLGFHTISGTVSDYGITFSTRKKIPGSQCLFIFCPPFSVFNLRFFSDSDAPTTPKKGSMSGLFMSVASPLASATSRQGNLGLSYPGSRRFEEKSMCSFCNYLHMTISLPLSAVPIYEGRLKKGPGFSFSKTDFDNLSRLPLYEGGKSDLPENALVAVGYTLNTYPGSQTGISFLSSNVQFAILLGLVSAHMV
jgi:hypothetical protein